MVANLNDRCYLMLVQLQQHFHRPRNIIRVRKKSLKMPKGLSKMIYKTLHKQKDGATSMPLKPGVDSGAPEGLAALVPHVAPVVLLLLQDKT